METTTQTINGELWDVTTDGGKEVSRCRHMTTEQKEALIASQSRELTNFRFLQRFSLSEMAAILTAAKTDANVEAILENFRAAVPTVNLDDPATSDGLDYLVSKGLITAQRAEKIRE